jgi:DNA-binding winged helix-turn-helix (wHTH) protein/TolB-like protein
MQGKIYEFEGFLLDEAQQRLQKDGVDIQLPPRIFDVLRFLVARHGTLVSYEELMDAVWGETFVEEGNLRYSVHALRKALGAGLIETVAKKGYRFTADVRAIEREEFITRHVGEHAVEHPTTTVDRTPKGRSQAKWIAAFAGLILLAVVVLTWTQGTSSPVKTNLRSIAVAPFNVILEEPGAESSVQRGFTEATNVQLRRLRDLQVTRLQALEPYFEKPVDPVAMGKDLGVDTVVNGSVRVENGSYRVSFEVLDLNGGTKIAETVVIDRSAGNDPETIAALRIARKIDLGLAELRDEALIPPGALDDEARRNFLLAQRLPRENDLNRWPEAVQLMRKVVAAAPDWPLGNAKLAEALMLVEGPGSCAEARQVAARALELDANSADAYVVIGSCDVEERRWSSGEEHLRKAIAISPESSKAHVDLGLLLAYQRRFAEAEIHIKRALELEPLVPYFNVIACQHYYYDKKWNEALKYCEQAEQLEPGYFLANKRIYWVYVMQGRWDKVREITFGKRSDEENLRDPLARPLVQGDVRGYWEANLQDRLANKSKNPSPMAIASYYSMLGDVEKTISLLEQAVAENSDQVKFLFADPIWDSVRREPRYRQLVREIGLSISADPNISTRTAQ